MCIGVSLATPQNSTSLQKRQCDTTEIALDIEEQTDPARIVRFEIGVNRESLRNPQWKSMPHLEVGSEVNRGGSVRI
jgi:hypothetical protein